jgi:hypothetical protein
MGLDRRNSPRRRELHLALDISIVVGALIIWALLSHLPWHQLWEREAARDCIYLGRAGAHCIESSGKEGGAQEQACKLLGRAGRSCAPEPSSR